MGFFDTVVIDNTRYNVKLYGNENRDFSVGDRVGSASVSVPVSTYSIRVRENTYINIVKGVIDSVTHEPKSQQVVDEWGKTVSYTMTPVEIPEDLQGS